MTIVGIILVIIGFVFNIAVVQYIGYGSIAVGAVLLILGAVGKPVGGRKVWFENESLGPAREVSEYPRRSGAHHDFRPAESDQTGSRHRAESLEGEEGSIENIFRSDRTRMPEKEAPRLESSGQSSRDTRSSRLLGAIATATCATMLAVMVNLATAGTASFWKWAGVVFLTLMTALLSLNSSRK